MDAMHNVLILGTGRSGTSMTASLFRQTPAYMGDHPLPPNAGNPTGYFEDVIVNLTNDMIIEQCLRWPIFEWRLRRRLAPGAHVDRRAFWMASPRLAQGDRVMPDGLRGQMTHLLARRPFVFKDPRFCVTLPHWLLLLPTDTRFLVVFREPQRTVASMLKISRRCYRPALPVDAAWCESMWTQTHDWLLAASLKVRAPGDWLFVHFDDVLSGQAVARIENFVGTPLDRSLLNPDQPEHQRIAANDPANALITARTRAVYDRLLDRARADATRFAAIPEAGVRLADAA